MRGGYGHPFLEYAGNFLTPRDNLSPRPCPQGHTVIRAMGKDPALVDLRLGSRMLQPPGEVVVSTGALGKLSRRSMVCCVLAGGWESE